MPRENRKRGKKHKKQQPDEEHKIAKAEKHDEESGKHAGPSWIVARSAFEDEDQGNSLDAPYGCVDPDVKAYFKTVDNKLREWQELSVAERFDEGDDADPNEERRMFLVAALQELSGKEKQLATDPDCSNVLERMAYSMDDFVKRVFVDRLAGSYEKLSRHRFGSHVVQTLLTVARATICREARGVISPSQDGGGATETGRLPLLTELIINLSEELLPSTASLIMDPFASHVLRALLLLLCPSLPSAMDSSSILRSKKSAKHRARQGPMKSVFGDGVDQDTSSDKGKSKAFPVYPAEFETTARKFVKAVKDELGGNEVRALAADKVGCPVLVLLLEMESIQGTSTEPGSLMDSVSAGLVSATLQAHRGELEPSDYVLTLLREPSASHLLERLVVLAPEAAFDAIWDLYFSGKLNRLAVHPVANFVVARAIERARAEQFLSVLEELKGLWSKLIKNARTGVFKALVGRAVQLKSHQGEVMQAVFDAFSLHSAEEQASLVECVLCLKTYTDLQRTLQEGTDDLNGENAEESSPLLEPTIQGSVLLQSLLHLDVPHNQVVIQSLVRLPASSLLEIAHHPTSSRILDALLTSPTVPASTRRQLILSFQGHFPSLIDDRVGSRVGERLWSAADPYLKEKIARSLIPHENALVGSRYGKFFMRGLNLYLLKRDPEKWKTQQVQSRDSPSAAVGAATKTKSVPATQLEPKSESKEPREETKHKKQKRKRKAGPGPHDEIDELFDSALGKRQKKGNLGPTDSLGTVRVDVRNSTATGPIKEGDFELSGDKELGSVFNAIRNAPKELSPGGKKKR